MGAYLQEIFEIVRYKELLRNLVLRDIKIRYKRSVLGFFWVMLNPLLMMVVLHIVFSGIFKVSTGNYTAYLISGIILWSFFSQSTASAMSSFLINRNIISKVYLPKAIFPLASVFSGMINLVFALLPLFLIMLVSGTPLGSRIYLLPAVVLIVGLFAYGVSLVISTLTVFFHDVRYIYEVLLMVWMYGTPIFYPESIIPERFSLILALNPFYYFLNSFRGALYLDVPSLAGQILAGALFAVAACAAGLFVYSRNRDRLVYYL